MSAGKAIEDDFVSNYFWTYISSTHEIPKTKRVPPSSTNSMVAIPNKQQYTGKQTKAFTVDELSDYLYAFYNRADNDTFNLFLVDFKQIQSQKQPARELVSTKTVEDALRENYANFQLGTKEATDLQPTLSYPYKFIKHVVLLLIAREISFDFEKKSPNDNSNQKNASINISMFKQFIQRYGPLSVCMRNISKNCITTSHSSSTPTDWLYPWFWPLDIAEEVLDYGTKGFRQSSKRTQNMPLAFLVYPDSKNIRQFRLYFETKTATPGVVKQHNLAIRFQLTTSFFNKGKVVTWTDWEYSLQHPVQNRFLSGSTVKWVTIKNGLIHPFSRAPANKYDSPLKSVFEADESKSPASKWVLYNWTQSDTQEAYRDDPPAGEPWKFTPLPQVYYNLDATQKKTGENAVPLQRSLETVRQEEQQQHEHNTKFICFFS